MIRARRAFCVKLGQGGAWENVSFAHNQIRFGYRDIPHELAANGDWARVRQVYIEKGHRPATATKFRNEVQQFYESPEDVLWITFARQRLYWCFAHTEVTPTGAAENEVEAREGFRFRRTIEPWNWRDLQGRELRIADLRGSLTAKASYRMTVCDVGHDFDYLIRRINGQDSPEVAAVRAARDQLAQALASAIPSLFWRDFELLVELVFSRSGWRRLAENGEGQHDIDLELEMPVSSDRCIVQVKSKATARELQQFCELAASQDPRMRAYFVYHSPTTALSPTNTRVTVIGRDSIATMALDAGLASWIVARVG